MNIIVVCKKRIADFMRERAHNALGRQRIIVYMLHVVLIVGSALIQFLNMGGSQHYLLLSLSGIHLFACLLALTLYLLRLMTIPQAMTFVTLVSQGCIATRSYVLVTLNFDSHFLQLIYGYQVATILALFFLIMAFVRYTPFIIAGISLTIYALTAASLPEASLWRLFSFFVFVEFFICVLGELLRRNVMAITAENALMRHRETALMQAVHINKTDVEAYLRMSNFRDPSEDDVERLFGMLTAKARRNIINIVQLYIKKHRKDCCGLATRFPMLTKTEVEVCKLIMQGKKRSEICTLLGKSEKNIDVVRTHIRRKLDVPSDVNLAQFLEEMEDEGE